MSISSHSRNSFPAASPGGSCGGWDPPGSWSHRRCTVMGLLVSLTSSVLSGSHVDDRQDLSGGCNFPLYRGAQGLESVWGELLVGGASPSGPHSGASPDSLSRAGSCGISSGQKGRPRKTKHLSGALLLFTFQPTCLHLIS